MNDSTAAGAPLQHSHIFLGPAHVDSERKTWIVIWLCAAMMVAEIVGGLLFGSIALVADGLHMSTHAGALLLAALAYTYARKHCEDPRFTFGTGKFGDLAGFTSAIILAMIAALIGYESVSRLFDPVPIRFAEAIPVACLGLAVNVVSALLLSGSGQHNHGHGHAPAHGEGHDHDEVQRILTRDGVMVLQIFEDGVPARFRLRVESGPLPDARASSVETVRPDGIRQHFTMADCGGYLESLEEVPEPHAFSASVRIADEEHLVVFEEHAHAQERAHRDNNPGHRRAASRPRPRVAVDGRGVALPSSARPFEPHGAIVRATSILIGLLLEVTVLAASAQGEDARPLNRVAHATFASLNARDYDHLEKVVAELRRKPRTLADGQLELAGFYAGVSKCVQTLCSDKGLSPEAWVKHGALLDEWDTKFPKSSAAKLARAGYWKEYAWYARGAGYSNTVSKAQREVFDARVQKARALFAIKTERSSDPAWYEGMLSIALVQGA